MLDPNHDRSKGVGASEIGAIVGLNPYQTALDVWMVKTGRRKPFEGNMHTMRGTYLEPALFRWARAICRGQHPGVDLVENGGPETAQKTYKRPGTICFATPDFFALDQNLDQYMAPGDIKAPHRTWRDWWDEDGDPIIPDTYLAQVAWQALACEHEHEYLTDYAAIAFLDGNVELRHEPRSEDFEAILLEKAQKFWVDHVEADEPPELSGNAAQDARWLSEFFEQNSGEIISLDSFAPEERARLIAMVTEADELRAEIKRMSETLDERKNQMRLAIGGHAGIEGAGVRVTWKAAKPRHKTNWQGIAESLLGSLSRGEAREMIDRHTAEQPPVRALRFKVKQ